MLLRKHKFEYPVGEQSRKRKLMSKTSDVFLQTQAKPNCSSLMVCLVLPHVLIHLPPVTVTVVVVVVAVVVVAAAAAVVVVVVVVRR